MKDDAKIILLEFIIGFWIFIIVGIMLVIIIIDVVRESNEAEELARSFCESKGYESNFVSFIGGGCYKIINDTRIDKHINYCDNKRNRICWVGD